MKPSKLKSLRLQTPKPELSTEKLEQRARNILLFQLSSGAKSAKQLRDRLEKKEIPTDLAEKLITRFTEVGLIDDLAVAQTIAQSRKSTRGWSNMAIKRDLQRRGISLENIEIALQEFDSESEYQTALRIAQAKQRTLRNVDALTAQRRLQGFLGRRGYSSAIVYSVVREVLTADSHNF
ncbi:hypothetical protein A4Z71_04500 [Candidatus Rhodoluna planktonica]|uniref:Regulatory protein RecX n=1 Tax=Candidatus Rhodoluna planktonica TaxID=535712 RepID=A0A1D9DZI9_9MICO|nr:hypothetical protein A4Z71_04500 [Candidatus Rhodoluna planktonica]